MAVLTHLDQLILTFIMACMVIYFYTVIILESYHLNFNEDHENIKCDSIRDCFTEILNFGLRMGGGIGDVMKPAETNMNDNYNGYWFFVVSFFVIVNIIFLNIIFGIIVDTFSALREENETRDDDVNNICYVCGFTRFDFSRKNKDFNKHVEDEHDPWKYLAFLYYLKEVGETELNG